MLKPVQVASAEGLRDEDRPLVGELVKAWSVHREGNLKRHTYYTMHNCLVDLGISVPPELKNLNAACGWGKKCVNVMVEHTKLDSFRCDDEEVQARLAAIMRRNRLRSLYRRATTSALEQCFALYFVSKDDAGKAHVSAYPAHACGVVWDDAHDQIGAAMFVVSMGKIPYRGYEPTWINVVTDEYLIRLMRDGRSTWRAEYERHALGCLPVFMSAYEPTLDRPMGTSRITNEVMGYIDSAVRANVNEEIAAAFAASTQKYLLGTDGDPFENATPWRAYIGSIFNIDMTEDGTIPQYGQLPQPSMEPINVHWRLLCGRMSAATGIHVSQFGIVHDQPASGDAIYAENEPLILKCKDWNDDAADVLADVATACVATELGTTFEDVEERGYNIVAHLPNPAMPTLAQQTDSSVKIASQVDGFSMTKAFWLMNGFSDEEADYIMKQVADVQTRQATNAAISAIFGAEVGGEA